MEPTNEYFLKMEQLIRTGEPENIELAFTLAQGFGLEEAFVKPWINLVSRVTYGRNKKPQKEIENIGKILGKRRLFLRNQCIKTLPKNIGWLRQLIVLDLSVNQIVHIPESIGLLEHLTCLRLTKNHIKKMPPSIGKLQGLYKLFLSKNNMEELPESLCELKNLRELVLSKNKLKRLPKNIGKLQQLQDLHLTNNPLAVGEYKRLKEVLPNCQIYY